MKKCPYCAEDIQDAAIKCRHCGEEINVFSAVPQEGRNRKSSLPYAPLFALLSLIGIAWWLFIAYASYRTLGAGAAIKAALFLVGCVAVSPFVWNLADSFRLMATPEIFFARGMVDIFLTKLGFMFGPFIVAMLALYGGTFAVALHFDWIVLSSKPNSTAARALQISEPSSVASTTASAPVRSNSAQSPAPVVASTSSTRTAQQPTLTSSANVREVTKREAPPMASSSAQEQPSTLHAKTVGFTKEQAATPICELGFDDADGRENSNGVVWTLPSKEKIYMGKSCDLSSSTYGSGIWGWSNAGFRLQFESCHFSSPPHAESPVETSDCEIDFTGSASVVLTRSTAASHERAAEPSYDCSNARLPTELAICSSSLLATADKSISVLYKEGLSSGTSGSREQIEWLRSRNSCESDVSCIAQSETQRIHQLHVESRQ